MQIMVRQKSKEIGIYDKNGQHSMPHNGQNGGIISRVMEEREINETNDILTNYLYRATEGIDLSSGMEHRDQ